MLSNLELRGSGRMRNQEDLTKLRSEKWLFELEECICSLLRAVLSARLQLRLDGKG